MPLETALMPLYLIFLDVPRRRIALAVAALFVASTAAGWALTSVVCPPDCEHP